MDVILGGQTEHVHLVKDFASPYRSALHAGFSQKGEGEVFVFPKNIEIGFEILFCFFDDFAVFLFAALAHTQRRPQAYPQEKEGGNQIKKILVGFICGKDQEMR